MRKNKKIVIIAGPNGAGKTTFAREFLPHEAGCPIFVNADLIAEGLSPFSPEHAFFRAGRLMIEEIKRHVRLGDSFAFETTLSGRTYAELIPIWQQLGYKVKLVYLYLPDVRIAVERVKNRVRQGGHNVPEKTIRRRYEKGWHNFRNMYKQLADAWVLFDNAGMTPQLFDKGGIEI
ncbi:MAG: Zeta toxin family protein [Nitrospiraceae bacterium]|nr:MAG: Zeta toxin family protein [Nitrospiraceae bacterium]